MNEAETVFTCEIIQQSRFQYLVPAVPFVVVVVLGIVLTVVSVKFGMSQKLAGLIVVAAFIPCAGFAVWYATGSQGTITVTRDTLIIAPRLRPAIRLPLPPEKAEFRIWRPASSATLLRYTMGPLVVLKGGGKTVSVACGDAEILRRIPEAARWGDSAFPPSFIIKREAFAGLVKSLGLSWPEGASPGG